ncbi:hypothetical protein TorRG33x02_068200 [Trema orientale]|uniref:Uncharacterized protein n=1 Tax=Trema orientale TaxID=63057 RepID=A0A2P5FHV7_TREOI|nr:hypothetical protein TorRG33x02_068200 [Trema orientale]
MLQIRDSPEENTPRSEDYLIPRSLFEERVVEDAVIVHPHVGHAKVITDDVVILPDRMQFLVIVSARSVRLEDPWECDSLHVELIRFGSNSDPGTFLGSGIGGAGSGSLTRETQPEENRKVPTGQA